MFFMRIVAERIQRGVFKVRPSPEFFYVAH